MTSIGVVDEDKTPEHRFQGLQRKKVTPASPIPDSGPTVPTTEAPPIGFTSPAKPQPTKQAGVAEKGKREDE